MGEMKSSRRSEASLKISNQLLSDHSIGTELTTAWKSLSQSKAALRHIENRLEATPGSGVLLGSITDSTKRKSSRTGRTRDGQQIDDVGESSKPRGGSQQSPSKSSSRSPLRNATHDSNVRKNSSVEFKEPLASYREATPPPHPFFQSEACNQQSVPGSSYLSSTSHSDPLPSLLVYQRDTRDKQTSGDLDSIQSSAVESTAVRYLNDQPILDVLKAGETYLKAQLMDSQESSPCIAPIPGSSSHQGESSPSTSPGSASQRLENLKRHQPDGKLEKLKERIRRQRKHLEEAAEKEKLQSHLEQPVVAFAQTNNAGSRSMPAAIIRKVAAAPPAPIYKGFNNTETKIQTPDGKVWKEEEFHNLSREIYSDISRQIAESTRHQQQREQRAERSKERRSLKPVRKVHKVATVSDVNSKPVISPASWREGQKLVKMVLGPVPKLPREEQRPHSSDRQSQKVFRRQTQPHVEPNGDSRPNRTDRPGSGFQRQPTSHPTTTNMPMGAVQENMGVSSNLLPADIQGILDDLQLDCKPGEKEEKARKSSRGGSGGRRGRGTSGSRTRTPVSAWGATVAVNGSVRISLSASPSTRQSDSTSMLDKAHKKRHYDADSVRQYIARQQEERKRRQAEEKRAMKEEAERRNQKLQELYRKQRQVAKTVALSTEVPVAPVQKRLQETYNKLLLIEETQAPHAAPSHQMMPMYLPSGESDKENKRLEAPQSPSSSDKSLNDQPPPLSRNDLDVGVVSLFHPDRLHAALEPEAGPSSSFHAPPPEHLLSQLLRMEAAAAASNVNFTSQAIRASNMTQHKMSRIEALKAKAASLSSRIESEARKLAGQGINHGATTSMDFDTSLAPRASDLDAQCVMEAGAHASIHNGMSLRNQRSTGHSLYDSTALPGVGSLHNFRENEEKTHTNFTSPHVITADVEGPTFNSCTQKRRMESDLEMEARSDEVALRTKSNEENRAGLLDSSAGSISEGPLLSEGSFSEDEASPPRHSSNPIARADSIKTANYTTTQIKDHHRLLEFQREASKCLPLSPTFSQLDGTKGQWEELNKGSPLSVINIFTKNFHGHVKASERNLERNSPSGHSLHSGNGYGVAGVYEDDFVSSHSSKASDHLKRTSNSPSVNSHVKELMRRSSNEDNTGSINSHHSSFPSFSQSHLSSPSTSGSSPHSRHSTRKRGTPSDQSDATLVEEQRSSCSPPSEMRSSDSRKRGSDKRSALSQAKSAHSHDALREITGDSTQRPSGSPGSGSPARTDSLSEPVRSVPLSANSPTPGTSSHGGRADMRSTGELQYSPAVLQQRMTAELQYFESIQESLKQLGDVERLMGVSMAQQESATLAQMLKAKQHRHERELYELKIKAEREALETKLQMEENRQRVARAHIELQESLAASQKETLEAFQESTAKMMSQQAEAAQHTAEAAQHIREMTEVARTQVVGTLVAPTVAADSAILNQQEEQNSFLKQQDDKGESDSFQSEVSSRRSRSEVPLSSLNSFSQSDSLSFRGPNLSGATSSSSHHSSSHLLSCLRDRTKNDVAEGKQRNEGTTERLGGEPASSSIEEDVQRPTADSLCSDSIASVVDEKAESTSVATEYSLKFDESMTEDEIEERSFRSLLPSEAHRRGTMEKKSRLHEESEDDAASHNSTMISGTGSHNTFKSHDAHITFSTGQDNFSQFTMDMVRQYMKDEEVRLQHQSSLLHLRQKALKEKTRTELAWLELQKKRLRDKGEDDKMPPIRKKQRGLLIKLQQEQAEIKRLQEANKAARKERQLLLKQQEEIERMRSSTLRLKERLKCAGGEDPPETSVSEQPEPEASSSNMRLADDIRSPSPSLSISGSETSSIMQKLKKMRSHMDEKHCSPVHFFFSVFTAHHWASLSVCLPNLHPKFQLFIYNQLVRFLTKREQQLMQRRHHAEELLQWKQRLDREEAEVRRMEKEALAVWERKRPRDKDLKSSESQGREISETGSHPSPHQCLELRTDSEKELVIEDNSLTPESSIHTEAAGSQQPGSSCSAQLPSVSEKPLASLQSSPSNYTQDFTSGSQPPSRKSSPLKDSHSPAASPSDSSSKTKMQLRATSRTLSAAFTQPPDPAVATQFEIISDQSDIESRIKALKEELKKRKFMAYQLKREQKKRHKERLKAQEASLLKQLECYNNFIEKTKAELSKETDSTSDTNSQMRGSGSILEQTSVKPPPNRTETTKSSDSERTLTNITLDRNAVHQSDHVTSISVAEDLPEEEPQAVAESVTVRSRPECATPGQSDHQSSECYKPSSKAESGDENLVSDQRSDIEEDLEVEVSSRFEDESSLFNLEKEDRHKSQEKLSRSDHVDFSMDEEHQRSQFIGLEQDEGLKPSETSKVEEDIISVFVASTEPRAVVDDLNTSSHVRHSSASSDRSHVCDSVALCSNKEAPINDVEASPTADGYHDDFESTDSSPREDDQNGKPDSQIAASLTEINDSRKGSSSRGQCGTSDSQNEVVEEEIAEELSQHSGASERSIQSGRLLDVYQQKEDSKHDSKSIAPKNAPLISPSQSPPSPVTDEMPSFNIGDRVLVGGVQPGTLRFKGPTSFANGFWAGVELDKSEGSNNGTYDGVIYFECEECHGIFAPPDKITHLPDKFEVYTDTTEDDDSFFDDLSDKGGNKNKENEDNATKQRILESKNEQTSHNDAGSEGNKVSNENNDASPKARTHLNSQHHKETKHPLSNGNTMDIILDFEDAAHSLLISDMDKMELVKQNNKKTSSSIEREDLNLKQHFIPVDHTTAIKEEKEQQKGRDLDKCADRLLKNILKDTVNQLAEIKRVKEEKIKTANQMNEGLVGENEEDKWISSVEQKDGLPFFLPSEKEELSSPELCNRPESPVLGTSGQEELAKRLAELELSRELLDEFGDDQDWFDEDFGLSSRRQQQRLKQKEEEEKLGGEPGRFVSPAGLPMGGMVSSIVGEPQVKTPPRPELPLPLPPKLPEQPAMVVPHSAIEVEKMVHAATQEIWETCNLGKEGNVNIAQLPNPTPSLEYLGKESSSQDQEALSVCSYRKAVYDLTWEILQEIYAEDTNADHPQWVKSRQVKSSSIHRVKTSGDISKIQGFVTAEVLKLYGLTQDESQKTDWQKMLKFGRKKRDRVDHILVQELHEEEAQWVNYDEDELFVKLQLADSIFDALLKDTANVFSVISDKRAKRGNLLTA
ncbi:centrosome-associated protein 350 [Xenentodon cancila]